VPIQHGKGKESQMIKFGPQQIGKLLILTGALIVLAGSIIMILGRAGLFKLPGDLVLAVKFGESICL